MRPSRIVQEENGNIIKIAVQDYINNDHFFQVKKEDYLKYLNGELIQNCFPYLTPDEREIFISGITPQMWDQMFGEEEE